MLEVKIFQYNITFGLYMLDPWERWVFNVAALVTVSLLVYSVGRQAQWVWEKGLLVEGELCSSVFILSELNGEGRAGRCHVGCHLGPDT